MKRVHFVGGSGQGKTTLVVEIIEELTRRGYRVGALKHSKHQHELDVPGKDSHRLRTAGASPSAVLAGDLSAVYISGPPSEELQRRLWALFEGCDLVVIEGKHHAPEPKPSESAPWVEVWRHASGNPPMAADVDGIAAIITDDEAPPSIGDTPTWPRAKLREIVDRLASLLALAS
jgi:molybdopterin-guanine dinucleotide biosynthesis protein B